MEVSEREASRAPQCAGHDEPGKGLQRFAAVASTADWLTRSRERRRPLFPPGKPDLFHQRHMRDGQSSEADEDQLNDAGIKGNFVEKIPSEDRTAEDPQHR